MPDNSSRCLAPGEPERPALQNMRSYEAGVCPGGTKQLRLMTYLYNVQISNASDRFKVCHTCRFYG